MSFGPDKPLLADGDMVGRYRIFKRIGSGAMGEVYVGIDEELGRRAAIKVLGSRHLGNDVVKERFLREARALAKLSHPHLITVFEAGHVGSAEHPYFAMELLEGGDTEKLLEERGPLAAGVVALIGAQAAAGLGEAARAQIIHRDVKPANLGISAHGVLKVTDFGLAKSHAAGKSLTGEGFVVGTADYIAPEQARGEELDERADVYALGCTLWHLLTGRPPFRSEEGTLVARYVEVMRAHLTKPVPDPRRLAPDADDSVCEVVMDMMCKDREGRPTFDEVAPRLNRLAMKLKADLPRVTRKLFTLPTGTPISSAGVPIPAVSSESESAAPQETAQLRATYTSRWPQVAAAAVAVVLGGAALLLLLRR